MNRYEKLRAAVVEVLDSEIGNDVVALRQVLLDALDDECEVEFVEAMERVPVDGACTGFGDCDCDDCWPPDPIGGSPGGGTDG